MATEIHREEAKASTFDSPLGSEALSRYRIGISRPLRALQKLECLPSERAT